MNASQLGTGSGDALAVRWAAERTLLAWIRTSLALFGLGFVLARFVMVVDLADGGSDHPARHVVEVTSHALGIAFVFVGAWATAVAALRYRGFLLDATPQGKMPRGSVLPLATSALVSVLGVVLALSLVFGFA